MFNGVRLLGSRRWTVPGPFFWALVAAFALGVIWYEAGSYIEGSARSNAVRWIEGTPKVTLSAVREWVAASEARAARIATEPALYELSLSLAGDLRGHQEPRGDVAQVRLRELLDAQLEPERFLGANVVAMDGRSLAATQQSDADAPSEFLGIHPERAAAVLGGATVTFSVPTWRERGVPSPTGPSTVPKWFIATPIQGDGEVVAILLFRLDLESAILRALTSARGGDDRDVFAVDGRNHAFTSAGSWTQRATRERERSTGSDATGYRNSGGHWVVGSWAFDAGLEMGFGVELEESELLANVQAVRWISALVLLGVWGWTIGCMGALLRARHLVRRVSHLVHRATERRVGERTAALSRELLQLREEIEEQRLIESRLRLAQRSLEESSQRFARLSQIDALTNLANRRRFDEFLEREWRRGIRQQTSISLVVVEVDYFKLFNDTYGHGTGDDCLREIAEVIASAARRPGDLAARLGGEEFAAILCDTDLEGARAVAHHVRSAVESLAIDHETTLVQDLDVVTVSIGVASTLPDPNSGPSVLLYHADEALYLAKQEGHNCVRTYEETASVSQSTSLRISASAQRTHEPRRS